MHLTKKGGSVPIQTAHALQLFVMIFDVIFAGFNNEFCLTYIMVFAIVVYNDVIIGLYVSF